MRIQIVTPKHVAANTGNLVTANRWRVLIEQLGHDVQIVSADHPTHDCDTLIALHAGHSAKAVLKFHKQFPDRPIILGTVGTDLYTSLKTNQSAKECLKIADRIVVLQPRAIDAIPKRYRDKCSVIYQSTTIAKKRPKPLASRFEVCVIGHLRPVKDPFRAAMAVRQLPEDSKIRVVHFGAALSDSMRTRAEKETRENRNYEWLGEVSHSKVIGRLLRSRLLVHSSKTEGGANVITEAIVGGVPVLSSHIPGSIGLLGDDYPGYFETGNTKQLRELLLRAEDDAKFLSSLTKAVNKRRALFTPERERESWKEVLELVSAKSPLSPASDTPTSQKPHSGERVRVRGQSKLKAMGKPPHPSPLPRGKSRRVATRSPGERGQGTAADVKSALKEFINPEKAAFFPRFFKTGPGEYGEGDKFIGVTVPHQRKVAKKFRDLSEREIQKLLNDPIHEHRLTGVLILVGQYEKAKRDEDRQRHLVEFYLANLDRVNNWDLVDSSAHKILGDWLLNRDRSVLYELAESGHLWRERVSVIACLPFIKAGDFDDILNLANHFLHHEHDLMHKAVGWMLREMGNVDEAPLHLFLKQHCSIMPRTMLRYAIEKLPQGQRKAYLSGDIAQI